jgi:hypothetical protein
MQKPSSQTRFGQSLSSLQLVHSPAWFFMHIHWVVGSIGGGFAPAAPLAPPAAAPAVAPAAPAPAAPAPALSVLVPPLPLEPDSPAASTAASWLTALLRRQNLPAGAVPGGQFSPHAIKTRPAHTLKAASCAPSSAARRGLGTSRVRRERIEFRIEVSRAEVMLGCVSTAEIDLNCTSATLNSNRRAEHPRRRFPRKYAGRTTAATANCTVSVRSVYADSLARCPVPPCAAARTGRRTRRLPARLDSARRAAPTRR